MKALKVGFFVDHLEVSSEVFDVVNHVSKSDLFLNPVIIHGYIKENIKTSIDYRLSRKIKNFGWIGTINYIFFSMFVGLIKKIELKHFQKKFPNFMRKYNLEKIPNLQKLSVDGIWSNSELFLSFSDNELEKIRNEQLDCIIRCGSGILKGNILSITKLGVLTLNHYDNQINRDGPAGFWEVLNNEPSSGFIIQKLNNETDEGGILLRGNIMTLDTWSSNYANIVTKSNYFLMRLLDNISKLGKLPDFEIPILHDQPLYKLNKKTIFRYIFFIFFPIIINKILNKFLGPKVERWSIAFLSNDNLKRSLSQSTEVLSQFKEVKNPKGSLLADPFIINHKGRKIIFVEDMHYSDNKGRISAIEIKGEKHEFLGVVLEEDFHLSFPFVFEEEKKIYMIPETSQSNDIRLYECIEFPLRWKLKEILMKNVSAVDTMIIKKSNLWFMLTTICSAGLGDHFSELHIFYSDTLSNQKWKPIKSGNPVIFDSQRARNGGLFRDGDRLYRINQIGGKSHYGKGFGINIVDILDVEKYIETRVKTVNADFRKDIVSTHHFNADKEVGVVDYARRERLRKIVLESKS